MFNKGANSFFHPPQELIGSQAQALFTACLDHIDDRFGLAEIDSSIEKSASGKFARFSQPGPVLQHKRQYLLKQEEPGVRLDFNDVFAGVGVGGSHVNGQNFIHNFG